MASIFDPASTSTGAGPAHISEPSTANPDQILSTFPEMTEAERASAISQTIRALDGAQLQATLSAFLGGRNKAETLTKLCKPDTYDGKDRPIAVQWRYQTEQYVKKSGLTSSFDQIRLAASYLVGDCIPFIERVFNELVEDMHVPSHKTQDTDPWPLGSWEWFIEEFTQTYIGVDVREESQRQLWLLRPEKNEAIYQFNLRFRNHADYTDFNDPALIDIYQRAIPSSLFERVMLQPDTDSYSLLNDWMSAAGRADRVWRITQERKKAHSSSSSSSSSRTTPKSSNVNSMQSSLSSALKKDIVCYWCGIKGHCQNECRKKASGKPRTYTGANNTSSSNPAVAVNSAAPASSSSAAAGESELLTLVRSLQADIKKIKNRRGKGSSKGGGTAAAVTTTPAK